MHLFESVFEKHRDRTVLVVLIIMAFGLMAPPEPSQLAIGRSALTRITLPVQRATTFMHDYTRLRAENERLARMVATLSLERERLLGILLVKDDDDRHRAPRPGDRLQDPRNTGDIRHPVEVDQNDKYPIAIYDLIAGAFALRNDFEPKSLSRGHDVLGGLDERTVLGDEQRFRVFHRSSYPG